MSNYYAVAAGHKIGIYENWEECNKNIEDFKNPIYKKFDNIEDAKKFIEEYTDTIYVYTDGACYKNGEKNATAGIGIYFSKDNENNVSEKLEGEYLTNNIAELTAVIKAINIIKKMEFKNKVIVTDSEYVIKCATTYGEKLAKNEWKSLTKDKEIPNLNLVKKIYELTNKYNIKYKHVKAHTGNKDRHSISNYYADKLANDSIGISGSSSSEGERSKKANDNNKIYLNVSYAEKDKAKADGARWDPGAKKWYVCSDHKNKDKLISTYK
jgi:ribonuclease HI